MMDRAVGQGLLSRKCPLCNFESPTIPLLLSHLRSVHASDPRFHVTCGIGGCTVSSRSFSALYSHIYRHHPNEGIVQKGTYVSLLQPSTVDSLTSSQPLSESLSESLSEDLSTLPDDDAGN